MNKNHKPFIKAKREFNCKIISAFPGTGKSHFFKYMKELSPGVKICDSDSSTFDKSKFPENYIKHIKDRRDEGYKYILISSHKEVRDALVDNKIPFTLVYPDESLKEEYLKRYKDRGSSKKFIETLDSFWEDWIRSCRDQTNCSHVVLPKDTYLADLMK